MEASSHGDLERVVHVRLIGPEPSYKTPGAAGFDLRAALQEPMTLHCGCTALIPTGIRLAIPEGFEMQVRSRSGLATEGVFVLNAPGTVDSDYRGEVKVILHNAGGSVKLIQPGERIAQGVIAPVYRAAFERAESLDATERGDGGFGSTGDV